MHCVGRLSKGPPAGSTHAACPHAYIPRCHCRQAWPGAVADTPAEALSCPCSPHGAWAMAYQLPCASHSARPPPTADEALNAHACRMAHAQRVPCRAPQTTVNNQIVVGTLMNLCDNPNTVSVGQDWVERGVTVRRTPIIVTGGWVGGPYGAGLMGGWVRGGRLAPLHHRCSVWPALTPRTATSPASARASAA